MGPALAFFPPTKPSSSHGSQPLRHSEAFPDLHRVGPPYLHFSERSTYTLCSRHPLLAWLLYPSPDQVEGFLTACDTGQPLHVLDSKSLWDE